VKPGSYRTRFNLVLGHASLHTTKRFLGCQQASEAQVNDRFAMIDLLCGQFPALPRED